MQLEYFFNFFFQVCLYLFPILLFLVAVAKYTMPHSEKALKYMEEQSKKKQFRATITILIVLVFILVSYILSDLSSTLGKVAIGLITGCFVAFLLLAVVNLLYQYIKHDNEEQNVE